MARAADYVPVADLVDLRERGQAVVSEGGQAIALFHHDGTVHAVDNRCPHMGFPLVEGSVDDGVLTDVRLRASAEGVLAEKLAEGTPPNGYHVAIDVDALDLL